jgi:hypothetical protein
VSCWKTREQRSAVVRKSVHSLTYVGALCRVLNVQVPVQPRSARQSGGVRLEREDVPTIGGAKNANCLAPRAAADQDTARLYASAREGQHDELVAHRRNGGREPVAVRHGVRRKLQAQSVRFLCGALCLALLLLKDESTALQRKLAAVRRAAKSAVLFVVLRKHERRRTLLRKLLLLRTQLPRHLCAPLHI